MADLGDAHTLAPKPMPDDEGAWVEVTTDGAPAPDVHDRLDEAIGMLATALEAHARTSDKIDALLARTAAAAARADAWDARLAALEAELAALRAAMQRRSTGGVCIDL